METGKLIKELRTQKGMTQEELAEKTEVSVRTIQRIENGAVDPRAYTLQMIAKALEVEYSLLAGNESDKGEDIHEADDNNWLGLLHLSGLLPLIFPTLLLWNRKKEKVKGISEHYHAVISFQVMVLGVIIGCFWVYWKVGILTPLIGVLIANGLFSIANTIKVMSGDSYIKVPFIRYKEKDVQPK